MALSVLPTPIGLLGLEAQEASFVRLSFLQSQESVVLSPSPILQHIENKLLAYFSDKKPIKIDQRLAIQGTPFQKRVWEALCRIPFGETRTYGELALQLRTSARAVGNACRANPLPIVIPCHRVVAKRGIGGYAGDTKGAKLKIKTWLLQHENII